jgi:plasmid stabilization system protein ParE
MTYRVIFSPRARADVVEAFWWIADRSPTAGDRWYAGLEKAVAKLSKFPERNPVAEDESELVGITLRELLHGKRPNVYRILYSVEVDTVYLHYLRSSARGPVEP